MLASVKLSIKEFNSGESDERPRDGVAQDV